MLMQGLAIIPLTALFVYVLEFCILASAKKTQLITTFLVMLVFLIAWSGGSFLMRIQFMGLIAPWFHISLSAIWFAALALDVLISQFVNRRIPLLEKAFAVCIIVMLVSNMATGFFLAPPELVRDASGVVRFVYSFDSWGPVVAYAVYAGVAALLVARIVGLWRCKSLSRNQTTPLIVGTIAIIAGQALILLPAFSGFPVDMLSGIVFGIACFISLYNKHLFPLTLAFSKSTYTFLTLAITILFTVWIAERLDVLIKHLPEPVGSNSVVLVSLVVAGMTFLFYFLIEQMSNRLFLRDHTSRSEGLKRYQERISSSLSVSEISDLLCKRVCSDLHRVRAVRIALREDDGSMTIVGSSTPFEAGGMLFDKYSAVIEWLENHGDVMTPSEFARSDESRSMWEIERQRLINLDYYCIVPLTVDDKLIGAVVVTLKDKDGSLPVNEMDHLLMLAAVTAVSIKNSQLYERAAHEAQTDDLTGLFKRKYLLKELETLHQSDPQRLLSLILLSVDDFKLYNQLYGEKEGDRALRRIADMLSATVGSGNIIARYGGKEFCILMPDQDVAAANRLAKVLQRQLYDLNRDGSFDEALKVLTCSIGICGMPFDASSVKELMDNANLAVYQVKRAGKNGIMVYSTGVVGNQDTQANIDHSRIYSGYADTIMALTAAIDAKDHYTFTHSNHVAYYSSVLASVYGLNEETVEIVREAGFLHDIGKIGIPEAILQKPGRLTGDEYEVMKKHPENAVAIIRHLPSLDYVIPAVVAHHERWDGKGYPRRLAGEDIPLTARIVCIADCFDAITTKRCYQNSRDAEAALRIIEENAGTQFDPKLAELFVRKFREGTIELQTVRVQ